MTLRSRNGSARTFKLSYDEMLRLVATIPLKLCRPARTFLIQGRPSDGGLFGVAISGIEIMETRSWELGDLEGMLCRCRFGLKWKSHRMYLPFRGC